MQSQDHSPAYATTLKEAVRIRLHLAVNYPIASRSRRRLQGGHSVRIVLPLHGIRATGIGDTTPQALDMAIAYALLALAEHEAQR
jgi:hypothetical protein